MNVSRYLMQKGFEWKRRGDNAVMNCPFCGDTDKKFAVNMTHGAFNCLHLNTCGTKGSFWELQEKLGDKPQSLIHDPFVDLNKPKIYVRPKPKVKAPDEPAIKYLKDRGFSNETIKAFRIGSKDPDTVMLPYFKDKELINVKYRSISKKSKMWQEKDAEPSFFNRDNIEGRNLVICEGEYDCMALHQYGIESVSVPSGANNFDWIETEWEYLDTFDEIIICMDQDQAGDDATLVISNRIGGHRCSIAKLPHKDANDCLKNNVSESGMRRCIADSEPVKPDTLVNPSYFAGKIKELFAKGKDLFGTETPWGRLNDILKGWRNSELTIWSGRNGSGKSTILNQVILDLGDKRKRSCIYSGEMPPERYLRWAIVQQTKNSQPTPEQIDESLGWMNGKLYILDIRSGIKPEKLLSDFEYAARRYGVSHFVIDSLMKISFRGQDEYGEQKDFVNSLCNFAKKFDCHVHLVAHPRKGMSDTDEPGKVDVKGSSHITDLADNVVVLYRVDEKTKEKVLNGGKIPVDMRLFVKKNREFGNEGIVDMRFDEDTKCFYDGGGE